MREIKFRGKTYNGRWLYGHYYKVKSFFDEGEASYIRSDHNSSEMVMSDTIGQYTGLHDKNGKEIYEGDIVKGKYLCESNDSLDPNMKEVELIGKIIFKDGAFMVKCISGHIHYSKERAIFTLEYFHIKIEVTGNIYDNPELLKEE